MSDTLYNDAPDGWSGDKGYRAFELPSDKAPANTKELADLVGDMLIALHLRNAEYGDFDTGAYVTGKLENDLTVKVTVEVL